MVYSESLHMGPALLPLLPAAASFALAIGLIPVVRRLADRHGWYDPPNHRKLHVGNITHLGGVAIFISFAVVLMVSSAILALYSVRLAFLILGAFALHVIGLVDDLRNLRALPRLVAHLMIAGLVTSGGFVLRVVSIPLVGALELGVFSYPVSIIWIAAVVNAMNWSDGMDGYAGGIAAFAALGMGILGLIEGDTLTVVMSFSLLGALIAFLFSNFPPARIFMGDNGATFVGFVLAVLPVVEGADSHAGVRTTSMALFLLVPLMDLVTSIIRRIVRGTSPGAPDRGHIHHRLQDLGLRPRRVLAVVYPLCAFLGLVGVVVAHPPPWLPPAVVLGALIAALLIGLVSAVILVSPGARAVDPRSAARRRPERRAG